MWSLNPQSCKYRKSYSETQKAALPQEIHVRTNAATKPDPLPTRDTQAYTKVSHKLTNDDLLFA